MVEGEQWLEDEAPKFDSRVGKGLEGVGGQVGSWNGWRSLRIGDSAAKKIGS